MKSKYLLLWSVGAATVITAMALTAATYAWFTFNREVGTSKATSRTGTGNVELQICRNGGENFDPEKDEDGVYFAYMKGSKEYDMFYRNKSEDEEAEQFVLMPVSSADLKTFVRDNASIDNNATGFVKVGQTPAEEAMYFYHDTLYIRAEADEDALPDGAKMALYLDNPPADEGDETVPIVASSDGRLLTAARLGFRFNDDTFRILTLSDVNEGDGNTLLKGTILGKGKVLTVDAASGAVVQANDPAIPMEDVQIPVEGGMAQTAIAELKLNEIYTMDVYFYLEGCDPDCLSNRVEYAEAALNLSFYGMLTY